MPQMPPFIPASKIPLAAITILLLAVPAAAQQLTLKAPPQSTRVYARDGSLIGELGPQVRSSVALASLPRYVTRTFVAVEDRRFYEHVGVDAVGIARAVKSNLEGDREGASTITQQLIGSMYPELVDRKEITVERKLREARMAVELEQRYGKDRILEAYLNQIYFGHGWFGIDAAARHYFGKPAARLNFEETAMLAALPKGAGIYSPKINPGRALERRNLVLDIMVREGIIGAADGAAAKRRPIKLAPNHGYSVRPQWVLDQVRQQLERDYGASYGSMGLRVWTTVDPVVQEAADSALLLGLRAIEKEPWYRRPRYGTAEAKAGASGTNYLQGLAVTLDARSGEILAMVGGRDWEQSKYNRITQARRQPGSSFKPFVYAAALQRGTTPATVMYDTMLAIQMPGSPVYSPKNSDEIFRGPVTVRQALTQSINTVAVQLGLGIGLDSLSESARRFGFTTRIPPYPSSSIGAGVVRPIELVAAYTALANGGMRMEPLLIRRVADRSGKVLFDARAKGTRTLSPEMAFLVSDLLQDAAARGTGREARDRLPARVPMAGKTGTTDDGTDVWYVGYTPEMVTAVWLGFDKPRSIAATAYGGTLAAPIWGELMKDVYARRSAPPVWAIPAGLAIVATDPMTGYPALGACPAAATKPEYFLVGTEPDGACVLRAGIAATPADSVPGALPWDTLLGDPLQPDTTIARDTVRAPVVR